MERRPLQRLNTLQAIQNWWERRVIPDHARTPQTRFTRMIDEVVELGDKIDHLNGPDSVKQAGLECADVFIILMGVVDSLGLDMESLVDEKININHFKYNVVDNERLRQSGLTWQETLKIQKERWNEDHS